MYINVSISISSVAFSGDLSILLCNFLLKFMNSEEYLDHTCQHLGTKIRETRNGVVSERSALRLSICNRVPGGPPPSIRNGVLGVSRDK